MQIFSEYYESQLILCRESGFFLPDYNEKDESIKNILFMIDTSGSINSEQLSQAFSEIKHLSL